MASSVLSRDIPANKIIQHHVWGLPVAPTSAVCGYFLTRLTGDPAMGTNAGVLIAAAVCNAASIAPQNQPIAWLSLRFQATLGAGLLARPLLRFQTGSLSWREALVYNANILLSIEMLCLIFGAKCLWRGRSVTRAWVPAE